MKFQNPYLGLPKDTLHRTTVEISGEDRAFIISLRPVGGVLQTTLGILLKKLIEELKKHGINEFDPKRYADAVAGCTVTIHERSPDQPATVGEADSGDVGYGASGVYQQPSGQPDECSNPPSKVKGRVRAATKKGPVGV